MDSGWLIECDWNGIKWATFSTGNRSVTWTDDANRATRFCRKEDADGVIDYLGYDSKVTATEHIWE